jgi:RNA polymerase sigma-70 factor (ECF subfamily)
VEVPVQQSPVPLDSPAGFRSFYVDALPQVFSYFLDRCGGRVPVAEDLTQETFMAAVGEIKRGTAISSPIPWVLGIARHKLVDHYRAREREDRRLEALKAASEEDDLIDWQGEESRDRALAALDSVPGPQRAALVLRYLDGMSVPEVARTLGKSVEAAESLLARGKRSCRQAYLEAHDG